MTRFDHEPMLGDGDMEPAVLGETIDELEDEPTVETDEQEDTQPEPEDDSS